MDGSFVLTQLNPYVSVSLSLLSHCLCRSFYHHTEAHFSAHFPGSLLHLSALHPPSVLILSLSCFPISSVAGSVLFFSDQSSLPVCLFSLSHLSGLWPLSLRVSGRLSLYVYIYLCLCLSLSICQLSLREEREALIMNGRNTTTCEPAKPVHEGAACPTTT